MATLWRPMPTKIHWWQPNSASGGFPIYQQYSSAWTFSDPIALYTHTGYKRGDVVLVFLSNFLQSLNKQSFFVNLNGRHGEKNKTIFHAFGESNYRFVSAVA